MGRHRLYQTEEERKAANREANRRWRETHPKYKTEWLEKHPDYYAEFYNANKDKKAAQGVEYRSTKKGRAVNLVRNYRYTDKLYSRGECTITADWIVENIFSQPCHYCGKTDWKELGCDRIDNSLPHTPDNVVPCCHHCNIKKHTTSYDEFIKLIGKIA